MEIIILGFREEPCDKRTALWFFRYTVGIEIQVFVCIYKILYICNLIYLLFTLKKFLKCIIKLISISKDYYKC